jgi:hypothetical protein
MCIQQKFNAMIPKEMQAKNIELPPKQENKS